jgi:hypothetical protein
MIKEKPQGRSSAELFKSLADAAGRLYDLGFNVVPVDSNKKPIGSWNANERLTWEELKKRLPRASGIAITGNYFENSEYGVVILDLDDVDDAAKILGNVFGVDVGEVHVSTWPIRLCGQDHSFCGFTGPRPKGRVRCDCKKPNVNCDCVIEDTGEHRKLSELKRGMYIVVRVPKHCLPSGTTRSDAIEVMVSNYEVVYGEHPSGVYYQPVRYVNGEWVQIGIEDVGQGEVITCDELEKLIVLIKQSTTNQLEEVGGADAKTAIELNLPAPTKDLSEAAINQIINLVRPIWWLESEEGKHYHDYLLYGLVSQMRRAGIKHEVARRVVEAIINTGIKDIAGKVDQTTLQAIMRNEDRHFRETVDYIYTKPTAKLWGRKSFEETLRPAIEKAIEQGLLSVSKPEEWFNAIYETIFGKRKRKEATTVGAEATENVLDEYLRVLHEEGPINVPEWARGLEVPRLEYCLSTPICRRSLVTYTREDSQYMLLAIKEMEIEEDDEGNKRELENYIPIALLPKFMGQVYDPFYGDWYFIALHGGKVIAVSTEFDDFIRALINMPGFKFYVLRNTQYLNIINQFMPSVKQPISPGITVDGFMDPYGVLDVNDYGVEPLLKAYEWVGKYYPEGNAKWAWFNIMAVLAKVLTPLVRFHNRTFNDMVVFNVGRGGEGKSTLARYILLQLLGGEDARSTYYVVIDGPVKTDAQLRNLLSLNRLPLILDEQNRKALAANVGIFLSAVVGLGTIGVHAARYGLGIAVRFKNLRGMVVFTNVPFVSFLRDVLSEASDYAIMRRFIEIPWDSEAINPAAFKDIPELKPIYGFASRLWQKYGNELAKSADLLELIEKLAIAIGREYMGDTKVDEIVQYTLSIVRELRETKRNEKLALTDADALVERAYEFVASELKTPPSSAVKVLRYLLENPQKAGIKLTTPRSREERKKLKNELDGAIHNHLIYPYGIEDLPDKGVVGKDQDAVALYTLLKNAYDEEKVMAILFARTPLIPSTPKVFLGAPESSFIINGVKKNGYAIPLAELVRIFLESEVNTENEESGETTEEPSNNGESP